MSRRIKYPVNTFRLARSLLLECEYVMDQQRAGTEGQRGDKKLLKLIVDTVGRIENRLGSNGRSISWAVLSLPADQQQLLNDLRADDDDSLRQ